MSGTAPSSELVSVESAAGEPAPAPAARNDVAVELKVIAGALGRMAQIARDDRAALDRLRGMVADMTEIVAQAKAAPADPAVMLDELEHRLDLMLEVAGGKMPQPASAPVTEAPAHRAEAMQAGAEAMQAGAEAIAPQPEAAASGTDAPVAAEKVQSETHSAAFAEAAHADAASHAETLPQPDEAAHPDPHAAEADQVPTVSGVVSQFGPAENASEPDAPRPPDAEGPLVEGPTVAMLTAMVQALTDSIAREAGQAAADGLADVDLADVGLADVGLADVGHAHEDAQAEAARVIADPPAQTAEAAAPADFAGDAPAEHPFAAAAVVEATPEAESVEPLVAWDISSDAEAWDVPSDAAGFQIEPVDTTGTDQAADDAPVTERIEAAAWKVTAAEHVPAEPAPAETDPVETDPVETDLTEHVAAAFVAAEIVAAPVAAEPAAVESAPEVGLSETSTETSAFGEAAPLAESAAHESELLASLEQIEARPIPPPDEGTVVIFARPVEHQPEARPEPVSQEAAGQASLTEATPAEAAPADPSPAAGPISAIEAAMLGVDEPAQPAEATASEATVAEATVAGHAAVVDPSPASGEFDPDTFLFGPDAASERPDEQASPEHDEAAAQPEIPLATEAAAEPEQTAEAALPEPEPTAELTLEAALDAAAAPAVYAPEYDVPSQADALPEPEAPSQPTAAPPPPDPFQSLKAMSEEERLAIFS